MWFILIVLYKKSLNASATLQGILQGKDVINSSGSSVLLWDNSPEEFADRDLQLLKSGFSNFTYKHSPANKPLSAVYNYAIEQSVASGEKYLMLLDDDSQIDKRFFEEALRQGSAGHQLLLPIIKNNGVIRSPIKYYIIKSRMFVQLQPGTMASKNLMAINSGMIIAIDFLKKYNFRYHERLTSYGTDNYFMKFYAERSGELFVLDYEMNHSLSFFDSNSLDQKLKVFREIKRANLLVHRVNVLEWLLASSFNLLSSFKYAIKYKTLRFFR